LRLSAAGGKPGGLAAFVSDRGDDLFAQFTDWYSALLAEQEAGNCAFYVLAAEDGPLLGRFTDQSRVRRCRPGPPGPPRR
jgi:hypothetical protein